MSVYGEKEGGADVAVCRSVLQCVAVCCSVLQCVAVCCSVRMSYSTHKNECLWRERGERLLQGVAVCSRVLQGVSE